MAGTVVENPLTVDCIQCEQIDEKRWLLSRAAPQAGLAYASFKHAIKGSVEEFLERAAADDPRRAALDSAVQQFREVYEILSRALETPPQHVIGCGEVLWKAPSLAQRIADAVGVPLTISTEPEPGCRGAALWALERIGAIERLDDLPASMGPRFIPIFVETTK
jgi:glycerol kinase